MDRKEKYLKLKQDLKNLASEISNQTFPAKSDLRLIAGELDSIRNLILLLNEGIENLDDGNEG